MKFRSQDDERDWPSEDIERRLREQEERREREWREREARLDRIGEGPDVWKNDSASEDFDQHGFYKGETWKECRGLRGEKARDCVHKAKLEFVFLKKNPDRKRKCMVKKRSCHERIREDRGGWEWIGFLCLCAPSDDEGEE